MESLEEFKNMSGLVSSIPKSKAFFCNVMNHVKSSILQLMPIEAGTLPIKYLGVPLISSRLLYKDCKILVERVQKRVEDWNKKMAVVRGKASTRAFCFIIFAWLLGLGFHSSCRYHS